MGMLSLSLFRTIFQLISVSVSVPGTEEQHAVDSAGSYQGTMVWGSQESRHSWCYSHCCPSGNAVYCCYQSLLLSGNLHHHAGLSHLHVLSPETHLAQVTGWETRSKISQKKYWFFSLKHFVGRSSFSCGPFGLFSSCGFSSSPQFPCLNSYPRRMWPSYFFYQFRFSSSTK